MNNQLQSFSKQTNAPSGTSNSNIHNTLDETSQLATEEQYVDKIKKLTQELASSKDRFNELLSTHNALNKDYKKLQEQFENAKMVICCNDVRFMMMK